MIETRNFEHIKNPRRRLLAYAVQTIGQAAEWLLETVSDLSGKKEEEEEEDAETNQFGPCATHLPTH